jgi:hypothetical protein
MSERADDRFSAYEQAPKAAAWQDFEIESADEAGTEGSADVSRWCPGCGAAVAEGGDLCEGCGRWLLEGSCPFCLAPVPAGARFCTECGNPPAGAECPRCSAITHFHFCPHCQSPVTVDAQLMLEALDEDAAVLEALSAFAAVDALDAEISALDPAVEVAEPCRPVSSGAPSEAARLLDKLSGLSAAKRVTPTTTDARPRVTSNFSLDAAQMSGSDPDAAPAGASSRLEEAREARHTAEEAAREALRKAQERIFASHQQARCFFEAIRLKFKTVQRTVYGWRCNWADVLHPAPQYCGNPGLGGTWVYKDEVTDEELVID